MADRRTFLKQAVASMAAVSGGGLRDRRSDGDWLLPAVYQRTSHPLVSNVREVTISVADFDESVGFYRDQFGYEMAVEAELSDVPWRKLWRLAPDTKARVAILRSVNSETGAFRIVQFSPTSNVLIRVPYRPLDTSFVGCDMPTRDVAERFRVITGRGWGAIGNLFTFVPPKMTKPVTVAVVIGPSGERLPLVSLSALQNDPAYAQVFPAQAPIYIAFQVTDNIERDTALFTSLGLPVVRDRTFQVAELNRAIGVAEDAEWRSLQVSHPEQTFGRVGLVQYLNKQGHNVSHRSDPPSLGVMMLSFRTADMAETLTRIKRSAATIMCPPTPVDNALYGKAEVLTIKQPNGGWLEFYT